nr:immunoglobulin heavy chain junction region [Mus musculus]MBK4190006.1 immunoglobulin heavy chain junction region [Mus musculus]
CARSFYYLYAMDYW